MLCSSLSYYWSQAFLHSRNRHHPQKPHLCCRCKLAVQLELPWWWGLECYRPKSQIMLGFEVGMYGVCTGQCMCHGAHIGVRGQLGASVVASLLVWDKVTLLFTALYGRLYGSEIFRDSNGFAPCFPKRSVLELQMHMLLRMQSAGLHSKHLLIETSLLYLASLWLSDKTSRTHS